MYRKIVVINLSLRYCVLNSHKCSASSLSETVHILKVVAIVTSEHLNLSTIEIAKIKPLEILSRQNREIKYR